MDKPILSNDGIRLRAPEVSDLDFLFRMENDESLWTVSCNSAPYSRRQLKSYIEDSIHDIFSEHQVRFVIEWRDNVTGCIDLTDADALQARAQVGIALLPEFRGQGIASLALQMICRYAESRLRMHQLYALVPADNDSSLKLFRDNGFAEKGRLQEWLWAGERFDDVIVFQKIFSKKSSNCLPE